MMLFKLIIIAVTVFLTETVFSQNEDSVSFYLVKQRWHTGIVIQTASTDSTFFPEITLYKNFKYIDAGWGDDEFYRYPDFDIGLALKALFVNTPSTIRIEGFNFDIEKYIAFSDIGYEIKADRKSFNELCSYISSTFIKNKEGNPEVIEKRYSGNIIFYKAKGKYNLFNTCNTWVARGFIKAGIEIDRKVFLAEQLFNEVEDLPNARRMK